MHILLPSQFHFYILHQKIWTKIIVINSFVIKTIIEDGKVIENAKTISNHQTGASSKVFTDSAALSFYGSRKIWYFLQKIQIALNVLMPLDFSEIPRVKSLTTSGKGLLFTLVYKFIALLVVRKIFYSQIFVKIEKILDSDILNFFHSTKSAINL